MNAGACIWPLVTDQAEPAEVDQFGRLLFPPSQFPFHLPPEVLLRQLTRIVPLFNQVAQSKS